ncbi:FAD-binding oxidoreductase, partial [Mesorhizobium sp. M7A.F.Ca.CA.002.04.1.1]|uniref:FAD-binding oxidoreductase n=1 Tax=Mesorhizobium sp. M7A.F.Ca.CA.002.04.1.1 TaxID=2496681 RepID=UPI000FD5D442
YWYSPVLKQQLDHVTGDLIVTPKNEAELIRVLAARHRHGVPVTPRGSGTGNYGQAMPLSGGVVLNLAEMNEIKSIAPGRVVTGPGAILADIDKATRAHSGQELRLSPSTYNTASIGGFIAGGSGGIGSINFGGLRDFGNVLRLRVVTMEAEPKALELTGADLHKVTHAYGTNGIISEVEMPLTAAYDWIDVIVGFDAFMDAARYGNALACQDGILTKLITPIAAPVPQLYFKRHQKFLSDGQSICVVMVAQPGLDAFLAFTRRAGGEVIYNAATATPDEKKGLPPAYELAWNHTTLRALRVDPSITYLQSLYPFPNQLALVEKMDAMFPGEVFSHLEFVRLDGNITCFGLPLVKFTTEARLDEIVRLHEANGCPIFNPHRYTLEEGGMKQTDAVQLAFKRQTDPQGLLNPGKMIAWENPDYDYRSGRTFLFRGLQKVG